MKVRIVVTKKDIREGKRGSCHHCPIARAIGRRLRMGYEAHVSGMPHWSLFKNQYVECCASAMPSCASEFIVRFDNSGRKYVKPFTFITNIPKYAMKK